MSNYSCNRKAGCISAVWRMARKDFKPIFQGRIIHPEPITAGRSRSIQAACIEINDEMKFLSVAPYLFLCLCRRSFYIMQHAHGSAVLWAPTSWIPLTSLSSSVSLFPAPLFPPSLTRLSTFYLFLVSVVSVVEGENRKWGWKEATSQAERAQPHRGEGGLHSASAGCG